MFTYQSLTVFLGVAVAGIIGFCLDLRSKLKKERREREDLIRNRLESEKQSARKEGWEKGGEAVRKEVAVTKSIPINPQYLPYGRYLVRLVIDEENYPISAVATQQYLVHNNINGKLTAEPKYQAWFIALPLNRVRTLQVPFDIVVDGNGMCYEPVKISVVPNPPENEARTAA